MLYVAEERDTTLLDVAFLAVENQTISFGRLHQVDEVYVMIFLVLAENHNVIGYCDDTRHTIQMLVHSVMEDILRYIQSEW